MSKKKNPKSDSDLPDSSELPISASEREPSNYQSAETLEFPDMSDLVEQALETDPLDVPEPIIEKKEEETEETIQAKKAPQVKSSEQVEKEVAFDVVPDTGSHLNDIKDASAETTASDSINNPNPQAPMEEISAPSPSAIEHSEEQVQSYFADLRQHMLDEGDLTAKQRKQYLKKLRKAILSNRKQIVKALEDDFNGRSQFQTLAVDYYIPTMTIKSALQRIDEWMEPENVDSFWIFWPGSSQIQYCAKGVVGIVAPWNYPFYLSILPLVGAISAGNRVILKPSEFSSRSSALLAEILEAVFPSSVVRVVQGGVSTAQAVTNLPLDHLFFTGSSPVGKKVMAAASKNLVPVTLELGGKSPAIVHPSYSLKKALTKIVNGKMMNGGQSCFAPDYLMCPTGTESEVEQLVEQIQAKLFPTIQDNNDYGAIITEFHLNELKSLVDDAREKGARVVEINPSRESTTNKLPLYLIFEATDEMTVMQREIFGPILPVVPYTNVDAAIRYVNERSSPLCAYYFDGNNKRVKDFTRRIRAGGVTINDTFYHIAQENLPFSGLGNSGMGAYHGWYSFLSFSHQKSVFRHSAISPVSFILGAPYKSWAKSIVRFLAWW